jgi:predicted PurR-regulated permease PerM
LDDSPDDSPDTKRVEPAEKSDSTALDAAKAAKNGNSLEELIDVQKILKGDWLKSSLTALVNNSIRMIRSSVGGFLSVFGFLLSLIIIPIYLFYFLIDARNISASWQDYLPIRASQFKDEVVSSLTEINGYIIAFFRGQLLVSVINGTATALGLVIVGLDFGLLIGLVLCVLGLIPYLGILVCWIPAVIIATVQEGTGTFIPSDPGWLFPLVVTGIFVLVQKIDSFFITPKVVASRVGLHPLTVIVSLFMWSLLIGGLLGTILAVPLTATLKVLLRRYVWERRILRAAQMSMEESRDATPASEATKVSQK